ncbi:MAG TPA: hypothetical protein VF557_13680 [Jatrophihabitans sp.]|uniref:hypothetical protein n=1 Tax=Jatrophihabitans sp. TaxID=1932789 RepID=UPI002EE69C16
MNDLDTTIKDLINSAVDRELEAPRAVPPLDRSRLAERPSAHPVARWSVPVLAAVVAALLAVGTLVTIGFERDKPSSPPGNSPSPAPSASASVSKSISPDREAAARAYSQALAGAREASEVAGVSVGPVSAQEAVQYKDSGLWSMPVPVPKPPALGKLYPITVRYVVGPVSKPASVAPDRLASVVSSDLHDGASGSCPQPFVARPGHTYLIHCRVDLQAGTVGKATFVDRELTGTTSATFNLNGPPVGKPPSKVVLPPWPSVSPALSNCVGPEPDPENFPTYAEAAAGAREASETAGVWVGPVSEQDAALHRDGVNAGPTIDDSAGSGGFPDKPVPGKRYRFTVKYVAHSAAPDTVLWLSFQRVASGSCPKPFLIQPNHTYLLRCEVTFLAAGGSSMWAAMRSPAGGSEAQQLTRPY